MFVVKYEDVNEHGVKTFTRKEDKQAAIDVAKAIRKNGRWVIVFDEATGKQVYNERD